MTKQSFLDEAMEIVKDLEEFKRSGSKEAFRKQLREEFVRRSGTASLDEALATTMTSLVPLLRQTLGSRNASGAGELRRPSLNSARPHTLPVLRIDSSPTTGISARSQLRFASLVSAHGG